MSQALRLLLVDDAAADRALLLQMLNVQARLLDAVGQAVIVTDLDGIIQYWNHGAETLYGWTATEVLGQNILHVTPSPASMAQAEAIMADLRAGRTWTGEFDVRRRDGTVFPAQVTDAPLHDEQGVLVGIIGISSDISEQRRAEDWLVHRQQPATPCLL